MSSATATDPYRLPTAVSPTNYHVHLAPDLDAETFSGRVVIDVDVSEPVEQISLNNDGLTIDSVEIDGESISFTNEAEAERLHLDVARGVGPVQITIAFNGVFNEHLVGFYLSRFTDDDGNEHKLATTQFEATHARKAFPCWDEPSFKATFEVSLFTPAGMNAVSNAQESGREAVDGGEIVSFAPTMVMSSYLVAFVIGPLEITDPVDVDGIPLRVVHVPGAGSNGAVDLTEFALDCGAFGLRYFSEYFGIPYPGDKVDLVAIPDFAFGAMENLGCITFRETLLLVDPAASTQAELQRVTDVIFHELAHMWFGDLVTMKWWEGLWLNEAFATFMEMRATDAYRPHWQRWTDFGLSRTAAFDVDSLKATRPIEFEVTSPEEAEGMFDILTYEKGAAVVRMLEQHLGEDTFREGIRHYMATHAYGNAETTDLWDSIESKTDEPVRTMMDSWIYQGGYPLISFELAPNGNSIEISQEPFSYTPDDEDTRLWKAPIRYRWKPVNGFPVTETILLTEESTTINLPETAEWAVANAEGASFLRVAYSPETLDKLALIALEQLNPVERYALVDDAWAAVNASSMTASAFLDLLESLTAETDRSVWQRIIGGFSSLDSLLSGDSRQEFASIVHDAIAPALAGLTLEPQETEDDRTRQLRGDLIRAMGTIARDHEIQEEAKRTVSVGRRDPELVETNIMAAAVDVTASIGDSADFDDFFAAYKSGSTPQEEVRYLYAIAGFPHDEDVAKLRAALLDGQVRAQNTYMWLDRALRNRETGHQTWEFITENWEELSNSMATSGVVRMVAGVATHTLPGDVERTEAFFEENPIPQAAKTLAQILERQRVGTALREREGARLQQFLAPG